ncbi:thiamine pyrophosphate-dependent enzyme [Streptosporangium saharense]|uniref:thiamine pyrophosphate-dependent enzyme n=1 Tax=Streptosporangium saharense TaxID=1706840 RepID=UPI00331C0ED0
MHLRPGEEAMASGARRAPAPGDTVVSAYRAHRHALARGVLATVVTAETYGRAVVCFPAGKTEPAAVRGVRRPLQRCRSDHRRQGARRFRHPDRHHDHHFAERRFGSWKPSGGPYRSTSPRKAMRPSPERF